MICINIGSHGIKFYKKTKKSQIQNKIILDKPSTACKNINRFKHVKRYKICNKNMTKFVLSVEDGFMIQYVSCKICKSLASSRITKSLKRSFFKIKFY